MSFRIEQTGSGPEEIVKLFHPAHGEYAVWYPYFGGLLNELALWDGNRIRSVLDGYPDRPSMEKLSYSRGIKMSPFPNRIRDGAFRFRGQAYQLPINKPNEHNAIHGFLQKAPFQLESVSLEEEAATLVLSHQYLGNYTGFPFPYSYRLEYRMEATGSLSCTTKVVNEGSETMPLGDGWHPYFRFDGKADDWWLQLPSTDYLGTDERLLPTGEIHRLEHFSARECIGEQLFDTGFRLSQTPGTAKTLLLEPKSGAALELWQETGPGKYNFLQVYIPPSRDSIALEPMTCAADAFNSGQGLIELAPGEGFEASYGVRLI